MFSQGRCPVRGTHAYLMIPQKPACACCGTKFQRGQPPVPPQASLRVLPWETGPLDISYMYACTSTEACVCFPWGGRSKMKVLSRTRKFPDQPITSNYGPSYNGLKHGVSSSIAEFALETPSPALLVTTSCLAAAGELCISGPFDLRLL